MIRAHEKREGEMIPLWWAVAYRDFDRDCSICYPIPLHLAVRWLRDLRFWFMRVGRDGYREQIEKELYRKGRRDGYEQGQIYLRAECEAAYQDGRKSAFRDLERTLDEGDRRPFK